ncbi:unnamed protein product [Victoria cruziana]
MIITFSVQSLSVSHLYSSHTETLHELLSFFSETHLRRYHSSHYRRFCYCSRPGTWALTWYQISHPFAERVSATAHGKHRSHPTFFKFGSIVLKNFIHRVKIYRLIIYAAIQREETRRRVMQGASEDKIDEPKTSQAYLMNRESKEASIAMQSEARNHVTRGKSSMFCTYCKKPGHLKDKCWSLYEKPANRGGKYVKGNFQYKNPRRKESSRGETHESNLSELARLLKQVAT